MPLIIVVTVVFIVCFMVVLLPALMSDEKINVYLVDCSTAGWGCQAERTYKEGTQQ